MTDTGTSAHYKIAESSCYTKIRYQVRVAGGRVLKGALDPEVMDFITGYSQVVPGLEKRLIGHGAGEKLSFTVPAEEAFGPRHQELVFEKPLSDFHFPKGMSPRPGMEIPLLSEHPNAPDTLIIREVKDDGIVVDLNHPLAGADLEYDLQIVEARPATSNDICSEWEESATDSCCSSHAPVIVLGEEQAEDR
jgi:FKBP-type peptidyl-prolyl cis-trans isomerase SlyD